MELQERYPVDPESRGGVPEVIRTGRTEHIPLISDEILVQAARDEEHLQIIRRLGLIGTRRPAQSEGQGPRRAHPRERWVVLVGDVCGKGPEAAALTGLVRWTANAVAGTRWRPSTLLRSVNQEIIENNAQDTFCTACAVRIDVAEGSVGLTIARAGHPAPLVLRADGIVEEVNPKGPLLGILADTA
jgi:serine phosphatase RsbU (regulator of sigma subunit)